MKEAIVIVPGIMGSVLKDGDRVVWPGSVAEMVLPYSQMPALLKPGLVATDVIRSVSISRQYIQLIDAMSACGFVEADGTLTVFPYDWRKDNALAAAGLATHLDALVERLGDVTITLLAHSMGGLVSRCYLESGQFDGRSAFSAVKALITMGTPHRGAPMALAAALGMEKRLFLNKHEVQQVASDANFPSLYQLLPPRHEPFVWERGDGLRSATHDLYDPAVATLLGLSEPNLASAQAFHAMLDLARKPKDVRYFAFAGTHESTVNAMHYKDKGGPASVRKLERERGGDGTVPFWSAAPVGIQCEPVAGSHGDIYTTESLKKLLANLLGKDNVLGSAGLVPELSLRDEVVPLSNPFHLSIHLPAFRAAISGELRIRRCVDGNGVDVAAPTWKTLAAVVYAGPPIDHLAVLPLAPDFRGVYQIALFETVPAAAAAVDLVQSGETVTLFVQG
jgi:pimeloyl-ACP methyl ester carboxylesterase